MFYRKPNKRQKLTSVSGTYNIDLNAASDFHLTMTADTDFTFTNTPTGDEVRRCKIRLTGEFAPTWTQAGLNVFGDDYDGTKWNDVLVEIWLDGTIKGLLIFPTKRKRMILMQQQILSGVDLTSLIIEVKTDNSGTSASNQFTIPTGLTYNYDVND